jgi:hypothetical protein
MPAAANAMESLDVRVILEREFFLKKQCVRGVRALPASLASAIRAQHGTAKSWQRRPSPCE